MPKNGIKSLEHEDILSFEEIVGIVKTGIDYGINKVRITGGEPLEKKGIVDLVRMIKGIRGIIDLSMTTNGTLLDQFARSLAKAGLQRINISLDTIDEIKFKEITQKNCLKNVFNGIEAAKKAGLYPIKLNCVVLKKEELNYANEVKQFAEKEGLEIRFIHQMNLRTGEFSLVNGGDGGNCKVCNRLRLTANGYIKPCLFSDLGFNIRKLGAEEAFKQAIGNKPKAGTYSKSNYFHVMGG